MMANSAHIARQLLEDDEDPKDFVMRSELYLPKTWGELKVGDVVYDPETATVYDISQLTNHQVWVHGHSPAYAYGEYVQNFSFKRTDKLAPAYYLGRAEDLGHLWKLRAKL